MPRAEPCECDPIIDWFHEVELRAREIGPQRELEVTLEDVDALFALQSDGAPDYQAARGMYRGQHWRRAVGPGCFHLRVHGERAWLHWDRWDPRRYPVRHVLETPVLAAVAGASAGAASVLVGALLRSR